MARVEPLDDADRAPWLDAVAAWIGGQTHAGTGGVVSCSALKRVYRDRLRGRSDPAPVFVFLDLPRACLAQRLGTRRGHFMPAALLDSQLATLEPPEPDEVALVLDGRQPVDLLVEQVVARLADDPEPGSGRT